MDQISNQSICWYLLGPILLLFPLSFTIRRVRGLSALPTRQLTEVLKDPCLQCGKWLFPKVNRYRRDSCTKEILVLNAGNQWPCCWESLELYRKERSYLDLDPSSSLFWPCSRYLLFIFLCVQCSPLSLPAFQTWVPGGSPGKEQSGAQRGFCLFLQLNTWEQCPLSLPVGWDWCKGS